MDSPEYKTLVQHYPALIFRIQQSPEDIVFLLKKSGILAPRDFGFLNNPLVAKNDKAVRLLNIVLNQVQIDPQVYHTFIAALKDAGDWTRALVSELEHIYDSVMQSPIADVHFTEEPGESLVFVFRIFVHIPFKQSQGASHWYCIVISYLYPTVY